MGFGVPVNPIQQSFGNRNVGTNDGVLDGNLDQEKGLRTLRKLMAVGGVQTHWFWNRLTVGLQTRDVKWENFSCHLLSFLEAATCRDTPGKVRKADTIVGVFVFMENSDVRSQGHLFGSPA